MIAHVWNTPAVMAVAPSAPKTVMGVEELDIGKLGVLAELVPSCPWVLDPQHFVVDVVVPLSMIAHVWL